MDSSFSPIDSQFRPASDNNFQVIRTTKHGMVLESQRSFEVGSTIALGFHVNCGHRTTKSKFISVEAIVVGSVPKVSRCGILHQEVTLMFSEIDLEDREILLNSRELTKASATGKSHSINPLNCLN